MKMLRRVEKKTLYAPIKLYRYNRRIELCDATAIVFFRTVEVVYDLDMIAGYWIDGYFWVDYFYYELSTHSAYRERFVEKCNILHAFAQASKR